MRDDDAPISALDEIHSAEQVPSEQRSELALHLALRAGDLPSTIDSLRSGADPNRRDPEGFTPLMIASGLGKAQMVEALLTAGADVHAIESRMGATALHKAAQSGDPDTIGLLLNHGSFIDQQSPILGNTPLIDSVLHKHENAVGLLLKRGARTTIRNHWKQSALDLAQGEQLDAIARLIEARNDTNAEQIHALTLIAAVKAGDVDEVRRCIAAGASVDERAPTVGELDDDYTPLGIAAREGRADIVRVLLQARADPRRVIGLMKGTPVHEASYFGHADVVEALTEKRDRADTPEPDLDAQGPYNGLTALHDAAWHGHLEAARVLVGAGARLDIETHAGLTPRELALLYGYDDLARFLAEAERE